ncbi:MAG: hypothetical protein L6R37_001855, partial [Teloschistes peruensis]
SVVSHIGFLGNLMLKDVQNSDVIDLVTTLALVQCHLGPLLLVGEGPCVKILDHGSAQLLAFERVFDTQSLHGIATSKAETRNDSREWVIEVLFWGGRWLRFAQLRNDTNDDHLNVRVDFEDEVQAVDWILDAALQPGITGSKQDTLIQSGVNAVLVTAQNAVFKLLHSRGERPVLRHVAIGPKSMLYSAHTEWTDDGRIIIVSGTVFGEVLVWSFPDDAVLSNTMLPAPTQFHHRFNAHEGSVFGVRISLPLSGLGLGGPKRLLASCSDDRTIRVWDISDFEAQNMFAKCHPDIDGGLSDTNGSPQSKSPNRCVAEIMGHQSRIWNVGFLASKDEINVISFGEDGTAQVWQLAKALPSKNSNLPGGRDCQRLVHQHIYAYHSGKNIWASAITQKQEDTHMICTGGADGRVVSYDIQRSSDSSDGGTLSSQWTMQDVTKQLEENKSEAATDACGTEQRTICSRIFASFEGTWTINRNIKSALSTYPSGTFMGEVKFESRPQSDGGAGMEYLYSENGTFNTEQGLSFQAKRRYVYRYQDTSDTVSVWFVKADDEGAVDYLFHELQLDAAVEQSVAGQLQGRNHIFANGYHLCVEDHYTPSYKFSIQDGVLRQWVLSYRVNGPQKDYSTEATYSKQNHEDNRAPAHEVKELVPLPEPSRENGDPIKEAVATDSFKTYVCLTSDSFLTTTLQGRLMLGTLVSLGQKGEKTRLEWKLMGQSEALKSSSVFAQATGSDLIIVGGNNGTIFRYDFPEKVLHPVCKIDRKIAFLHCQCLRMQTEGTVDHLLLAVGLGISVASVYTVGLSSSEPESQFDLCPYLLAFPDSWIVTSAYFIEPLRIWILGFRHGALAFYDALHFSIHHTSAPVDVIADAHGSDAVTTILSFSEKTSEGQATQFVLTTGRDGHYAVHAVTDIRTTLGSLRLEIRTVHRSTPPFGPNVEGATFDQQTCDLIIWGFRSKSFVVWNASQDLETMTVECGGAHRNWYYTPRNNGSDGGLFVCTKASVCNIHAQISASHRVLQSGGHGREIKAMALSPMIIDDDRSIRQYIATGAEDTEIRIWSYEFEQRPRSGFKCLATITKHTTGIQQLRWSADGGILFSAAGREEFFIWRVQPVPFLGIGVVCVSVAPAVTEDGDLRIMDFTLADVGTGGASQHRTKWEYRISVVYSDGSFRVYHCILNPFRNSIELVQSGTYNTVNCLTQVSYLGAYPQLLACTASSDGYLTFWPILKPSNGTDKSLRHTHHVSMHQNYIKSMAAISIKSHTQFLIVSGGDDGALGIMRVTFGPLDHEPEYVKTIIPKAHAAAINTVVYVGKGRSSGSQEEEDVHRHVFLSSGSDQRVKTWAVTINPGPHSSPDMDVEVVGSRHTSVADVASLAVNRTGERVTVFVAGVGMECGLVTASSQRTSKGMENAEKPRLRRP